MSGVGTGSTTVTAAAATPRSIDGILETARRSLERLSPHEAARAVAAGAILVDIRPRDLRAAEGEIPGALLVERNVLEWRFDLSSPYRLDVVESRDVQVVVVCQEGYTSSLAAASLQELGLWRATDVIGGVAGWRAAGLPLVAGGTAALP